MKKQSFALALLTGLGIILIMTRCNMEHTPSLSSADSAAIALKYMSSTKSTDSLLQDSIKLLAFSQYIRDDNANRVRINDTTVATLLMQNVPSDESKFRAVAILLKGGDSLNTMAIAPEADPEPVPHQEANDFIANYQIDPIQAKYLSKQAWLVSSSDISAIMSAKPEYIQIFLAREYKTDGPNLTLVLAGVKGEKDGNKYVPYNVTFDYFGSASVIEHVIPCPQCAVPKYTEPVNYKGIKLKN